VVVVKHVGMLRCLIDYQYFCSCPRRDGCSVQMRHYQSVGDRDVPSKTSAVRPRDLSNAVSSPSINVSQADGLLCRRNLGLDQRSPNDIIQLVVSLMSSRTLATRQTVSPLHINCSSTWTVVFLTEFCAKTTSNGNTNGFIIQS